MTPPLAEPWWSLLASAGVLVLLGGLLAAGHFLRGRLPAEVRRKVVHVGMGLIALPFPWLFAGTWSVPGLAAVAVVALLGVRHVPRLRALGGALHDVGRRSLGEVYFPAALGVLWLLAAGDWRLWVVPVLILTLADALAAVIGVSYGRLVFSSAGSAGSAGSAAAAGAAGAAGSTKSVEGSVAFFATAFLSAHMPLLLFTDVGRAESFLIAVMLGLVVMMLEAVSWAGLDNLVTPLAAALLLDAYLVLPPDALVARLGVTAALVVFVFAWRRHTSLDDAALVAAAVFGYVAWAVGGWLFLWPPVLLFLVQVVLWPRQAAVPQHGVPAVLAALAVPAVWLALHGRHEPSAAGLISSSAFYLPFAVALLVQTARVGISSATVRHPDRPAARWAQAVVLPAAGLALTVTPLFLPAYRHEAAAAPAHIWPLALLAVLVPATAYAGLAPRLLHPEPRPVAIHLLTAALAAAASAAVWSAGVAFSGTAFWGIASAGVGSLMGS